MRLDWKFPSYHLAFSDYLDIDAQIAAVLFSPPLCGVSGASFKFGHRAPEHRKPAETRRPSFELRQAGGGYGRCHVSHRIAEKQRKLTFILTQPDNVRTMYFIQMKHPVTHRLTPEAIKMLKSMASEHGISQASILELMIRDGFKKRETKRK